MPPAISNVVQQHAEDAAILWLQRRRAASSPHYSLTDLAELDEQLEAHLDGLRVAGDFGWHVCNAELSRWREAGELFPAAILALESGADDRVARVIDAAAQSRECSRALVSALAWLTDEQAAAHLAKLLADPQSSRRRIGIAACAARGVDPGPTLTSAVASADQALSARALRAIGELARDDLLAAAWQAIDSSGPDVRLAAAWSVARLANDERAIRVLQDIVEVQSPGHETALQLVLRRLAPKLAAQWINELARQPRLARSAVTGAGIVGAPDAIPWLLHMMQTPALARVAGEAITMIAGLDLAAQKFDAPWPDGFVAGPTEDAHDDNVALDADENLPWPNVPKIAAWWERQRSHYVPGTRYLRGHPMEETWLEATLWNGLQRQRSAAALELALLRPDQPLFNVRAPGSRQQAILGLRPGEHQA